MKTTSCVRCNKTFTSNSNHGKRCFDCRGTCVTCGAKTRGFVDLCDVCMYALKYKKSYELKCVKCYSAFTAGQPKRVLCDKCRIKVCPVCSDEFTDKGDNRKHFCSLTCYLIMHAAPMLTCHLCKKEFKQRGGKITLYCSKECRYKSSIRVDSDKRRSYRYKKWITAVYERDNFTCQQCFSSGNIHAHHIKAWSSHPELRYDLSNGITLCQDCHQKIHGRKITRASKRFQPICESCGVKTKGHSKYCRRCAMRRIHIISS